MVVYRTAFAWLTWFCLIALVLTLLFYAFALTFWEIIRLIVITIGIIWLLLRRTSVVSTPHSRILLIYLVSIFALAQLDQINRNNIWIFSLTQILIGLAFIGTFYSQRSFLPVSRTDTLILSGSGILCLINVVTQIFRGDIGSQINLSRWTGTIYIVELAILYFVVSRTFDKEQVSGLSRKFMIATAIVWGIGSTTGIWRIISAYYYSNKAKQSFYVGQYEEMKEYASHLSLSSMDLRFAPLSVDQLINHMVETSKEGEMKAAGYVAIGDIADRHRLWGIASGTYKNAFEKNPQYPAIHAKLGNVMFEQGLRTQALNLYRQGIEQAKSELENHLALGVALVRMGIWDEATQALDRVIELSTRKERFSQLFSSGNKITSVRIDQLLTKEFMEYRNRITLFEVVNLLQSRGWKVFHPAMQIGSTDIIAPADIVASSSGAYSNSQESILVDGQQVSPHKRGYNIIVIDPRTGSVESADSFDTWASIDEAIRLAEHIKGIPQGSIVAATINIEGTAHLVPHARETLRKMVGINGIPGHFWSHAFIGIKGSSEGSAIEALGENTSAVVGVLSSNVDKDIIENRQKLKILLKKAAEEAPGKVAVFIPKLDPTAIITIARQ